MRGCAARLAADSEARYVEVPADQAAAALVHAAQLTQSGAALACALTHHAHEAGRAKVTDVVAAQVALSALAGGQAYGAVSLLVAAAALGMLDERIATGAGRARGPAERIALRLRRWQVFHRATGVDGVALDGTCVHRAAADAGRAGARRARATRSRPGLVNAAGPSFIHTAAGSVTISMYDCPTAAEHQGESQRAAAHPNRGPAPKHATLG